MPSVTDVNRYRLKDLSAEIRTLISVNRYKADVLHALYGEDQLNILLRYRERLKCAMVASYHLPVESFFMQKIVKEDVYKKLSVLDAAIVMSNSMISDYEKWVGEGKVFFVPHGIDTDIFFPNHVEKSRNHHSLKILTVGGHGRDWQSLKTIIYFFRDNNNVKFKAVSPKKIKKMFKDLPKLKVLTGISEAQLIEEYRAADVVLLPVTYATANNSLLEALACGTPVISTNTGGIPDYLDSKSGWLLPPGDITEAVNLISNLIERREQIIKKEAEARIKALKYDWKEITGQIREVYQNAFDNWNKKEY